MLLICMAIGTTQVMADDDTAVTNMPLPNDMYMPYGPTEVIAGFGFQHQVWSTTEVSGNIGKTLQFSDVTTESSLDVNRYVLHATQNVQGKSPRVVEFVLDVDPSTFYTTANVWVEGQRHNLLLPSDKIVLRTVENKPMLVCPYISEQHVNKYQRKEMSKAQFCVTPIDYNQDGIDDFVVVIGQTIMLVDGYTLKVVDVLEEGPSSYVYSSSACVGDFDTDGIDDVVIVMNCFNSTGASGLPTTSSYLVFLPGGKIHEIDSNGNPTGSSVARMLFDQEQILTVPGIDAVSAKKIYFLKSADAGFD